MLSCNSGSRDLWVLLEILSLLPPKNTLRGFEITPVSCQRWLFALRSCRRCTGAGLFCLLGQLGALQRRYLRQSKKAAACLINLIEIWFQLDSWKSPLY